MPLSIEQLVSIRQWMRAKGVHRPCELCGRPNLTPIEVDDNGVIPVLELVCDHCAHVRRFAADRIFPHQ